MDFSKSKALHHFRKSSTTFSPIAVLANSWKFVSKAFCQEVNDRPIFSSRLGPKGWTQVRAAKKSLSVFDIFLFNISKNNQSKLLPLTDDFWRDNLIRSSMDSKDTPIPFRWNGARFAACLRNHRCIPPCSFMARNRWQTGRHF